MVWSPRVTVAAVIEEHGHFLCVEELDRDRRVLNQPAGHLEPGEDLITAVKREVREETGREFTPSGLVGIYLWPLDPATTYLRFCFAGTVSQRLPELPLDPDIIETLWLEPAALRAQRSRLRSPLVMRCVEDALCGSLTKLETLHAIDL